jgi:hypothetical protein
MAFCVAFAIRVLRRAHTHRGEGFLGFEQIVEPPVRASHYHHGAPHVGHRRLGSHVAVQPKAAARRHKGAAKRVRGLDEAVHFGAALALEGLSHAHARRKLESTFQKRAAGTREGRDYHLGERQKGTGCMKSQKPSSLI